jgi:hypothetical protein
MKGDEIVGEWEPWIDKTLLRAVKLTDFILLLGFPQVNVRTMAQRFSDTSLLKKSAVIRTMDAIPSIL